MNREVNRFHLDESVDIRIAEGMRRRGIDVTVPVDVNLRQASDSEHLEYALDSNRVIVTCDTDFLRFHRAGVGHAGIAFCTYGRRIGDCVQLLYYLSECCTPQEMLGRLEYL